MVRLHFFLGAIYLLLLTVDAKEFSLSDVEVPHYEIVKQEKSYEIRDYEAAKWVCHNLEKETYISRFMETQFYELFQYTAGQNDKKQVIPITAPVTMKVITNPGGNTKIQMCFYIPKAFQDNTPNPINKKIYIEERPALTVFSRRFTGNVTKQSEFEEQGDILRNDLMVGNEKADFSYFYSVNYDPPVRAGEQQNEVWFVRE